jgi:threonylcarbamoyladenosine tRNA methylthiotransferase MtaB
MRVFLCSRQLGCPVNLPLTTRLHNWVGRNGWTFRDAGGADLIIVVSCIILREYRRDVASLVRRLARRWPRKPVLVTGCFVEEDRVRAPNVEYIPMTRLERFDALFHPAVPLAKVPALSTPEEDARVRELRGRPEVFGRPFHILVAKGCLSCCAYCVEKRLFPAVQSTPLAEVVAACREGLRKGYTNFIIGGVDVSSYGVDLGFDVTDLFRALFAKVFTGRRRLGLGFKALEPAEFMRHLPELKKYFRTGRIDWIYLPIESGSDRVLRGMNRRYRVRDVLRAVAELRRISPRLRIETDFVFCFPSETRRDFEASLRLLDRFDHCNLVVFGRHRSTAAFGMKEVFGPGERARRLRIIRSLIRRQKTGYRPECPTRAAPRLPASFGASRFMVLSPRLAAARQCRTLASATRSRPARYRACSGVETGADG